jgi:hypothetical protein
METDKHPTSWTDELLKASETRTEVVINVKDVTSVKECLALEAFLESAPKLTRTLINDGFRETEKGRRHTAAIVHRLLCAAQKNPSIQFLRLFHTELRTITIMNLLRQKNNH